MVTHYGSFAVFSILYLSHFAASDRYPDCYKSPLAQNNVCRTGLDPAERAKGLVDAMAIEEKLSNFIEYDSVLGTGYAG